MEEIQTIINSNPELLRAIGVTPKLAVKEAHALWLEQKGLSAQSVADAKASQDRASGVPPSAPATSSKEGTLTLAQADSWAKTHDARKPGAVEEATAMMKAYKEGRIT